MKNQKNETNKPEDLTEESGRLSSIIPPLLEWYRTSQKDMPWRENPTPYRVWLSEIMLQQTRIEAVIPYYKRFLQALPTIADLAQADENDLLKLWEGLGYYSRVRNLQKAAKTVMKEYGGQLPSSVEALKRLSGIGDYTAGAIGSIAFGLPAPAVDGNVLRVMMRVCAKDCDIARPSVRKAVEKVLQRIYPTGKEAGEFTQALMEVGEVVCIPNGKPKCEECPLAFVCRAKAENKTEDYPVKSEKKVRRVEQKTVLVLRFEQSVALFKRPKSGLLAGMWEFLTVDGILSEKEAICRVEESGVLSVTKLPRAVHIFTHVEWEMQGWEITTKLPVPHATYVTKEELAQYYAVPTAFRVFKDFVLKKQ